MWHSKKNVFGQVASKFWNIEVLLNTIEHKHLFTCRKVIHFQLSFLLWAFRKKNQDVNYAQGLVFDRFAGKKNSWFLDS